MHLQSILMSHLYDETITCLVNGTSVAKKKLCGLGYSIKTRFPECQEVLLNFTSDYISSNSGLTLRYRVGDYELECGTTLFKNSSGFVSFPENPTGYPATVNCTYTVSANYSSYIFLDSYLSSSTQFLNSFQDCSTEWLKVGCVSDEDAELNPLTTKTYCQQQNPSYGYYRYPMLYADCRTVKLSIRSRTYDLREGFHIAFLAVGPDNICGKTSFSDLTGTISSPHLPFRYSKRVSCLYTIYSGEINSFTLSIDHLVFGDEYGKQRGCDGGWLTITCLMDGTSIAHPLSGRKLCGMTHGYDKMTGRFTACRSVLLNFTSEFVYSSSSFTVRYRIGDYDEICGNTSFSAQTGIISAPTLPSRYPKHINCVYVIDSGHIDSVVLSLDRLTIGSSSGYNVNEPCYNDWLTITCLVNGTSMAHPKADRKLCGIQSLFVARFPACRSVVINFSSNYALDNTGFTIRYRIGDNELDCGPTLLSNSSGVISLPNNPTNFPATVNCTYTISTNRTSDIWLGIHYYSLRKFLKLFQDCDRDNVTITCIPEEETDLNGVRTRVLCSRDISSISYSDTRLVFVDCFTLKLSIRSGIYDHRQMLRFPFSVFAGDEICGNTSFSAETGRISSPTLPSRYHKRINWVYVIDSGYINSVVLSIDRLNIGSPSVYTNNGPCYKDWLTITCLVNGTSMVHPNADRKLCGSQSPFIARFPACRSVLLNFSSGYATKNTGFTIRYRIGDYDPECGNPSFSGPSGVIMSPRFPLPYAHNLNCLYSITGGQTNTIFLSFLSFSLEGTSNTLSIDSCAHDWLTVSCLSDDAVVSMANLSSSRRYCGVKTAPLTFEFPSCAAVVLNFRSDSSVTRGGFNVRYTVKNADLICGSPFYGRPSGVIKVPWNYTDYDGSLDCHYVINATEPSSISLTIWSISLQSLFGGNCQRDWLLVTCIDGQRTMNPNVTHTSCDNISSSIQLTFPDCTATQLVFHRDVDTVGRTFRIEYAVVGYADLVVNIPMSVSGQRGHAVGISLAVIVVVTGVICLGTFMLFRRHRSRNRSETLLRANEEERARMELEADSTKAGSLFGSHSSRDRDAPKYLPLRPVSIVDREEPSTSSNTTEVHDDIQPGL